MPRSRGVSPEGSCDSFHLASTCEQVSSTHRAKLSGHQRASASTSSTGFIASVPHRNKKDKDKDKAKDKDGECEAKPKDNNACCNEEKSKEKPCPSDDHCRDAKRDNDPCAPSDKKQQKEYFKVIPGCLPPVMCDVNDRPTVHQRRAEQAEIRARLARENEESANLERDCTGYNSGSQTPGYGSQKSGGNCPPGTYGPLTVPVPGLCPDSPKDGDRCSFAGSTGGRKQRPPAGGTAAGGGYGGGTGGGNCPPGTYGPLTAQVPGCPPPAGVGGGACQPGQYGQSMSPYVSQGGTGGRYGEPYSPGQLGGQCSVQQSPYGRPLQGQGSAPSQTAPQHAGGRQDDQALQINCICTATNQSGAGMPGGSRGNQFGGPPGGPPSSQFEGPMGGRPCNQFGGSRDQGGPFAQENQYGGGAMSGPKDGPDAVCVCSVVDKNDRGPGNFSQPNQRAGGAPSRGPQYSSQSRPLVQQGSQQRSPPKGQPSGRQSAKPSGQQGGGQRGLQQSDQGIAQILLRIDAGTMLLGQQSGPICIPCTIMPLGQNDGGRDDDSCPNYDEQDDQDDASVQSRPPGKTAAGYQGSTRGQPPPRAGTRQTGQESSAFRPPGKGPTSRVGGQQPVQDVCNENAAEICSQTGTRPQRPSSAQGGSPQLGFQDCQQGGVQEAMYPPQGGGFPQGGRPVQHGRNVGQGSFKQSPCAEISCPQGTRPAQGIGHGQQPGRGSGGPMCPLPGGNFQQGYQQGPGNFQVQQGPAAGQQGYQQGPGNFQVQQGPAAGQQGYQQGPGNFQVQQGHAAGQQGYQQGSGNFQVQQGPASGQQGLYPGQRNDVSGGYCPPQGMGAGAGQAYQQGGAFQQVKNPSLQQRPASGQGPADGMCVPQNASLGHGGNQQGMGPGQGFQGGLQDPCFCPQGSGQYSQGGPGFAQNQGSSSQADNQQASSLTLCIQRCCNAASNAGRFGHDEAMRGRHRAFSSTSPADCAAEGNDAKHGRQRRSNGHQKGLTSRNDDDSTSPTSFSAPDGNPKKDQNGHGKDCGIDVPTPCAFPICVVPCQPPCCVMPCQTQCCCPTPSSCCWSAPCCPSQPCCMCCMPKCCPPPVCPPPACPPPACPPAVCPPPACPPQASDGQNGAFGKSSDGNSSSDETPGSYSGCRSCCMRYGGNGHRKACRRVPVAQHWCKPSFRPLQLSSDSQEKSSATT